MAKRVTPHQCSAHLTGNSSLAVPSKSLTAVLVLLSSITLQLASNSFNSHVLRSEINLCEAKQTDYLCERDWSCYHARGLRENWEV